MQYKDFGKYIRIKRTEANMSLNNFALQNDIDPAILSRIENQKQDIKLNVLIKIANGFQLSPAELLKEFEERQKYEI